MLTFFRNCGVVETQKIGKADKSDDENNLSHNKQYKSVNLANFGPNRALEETIGRLNYDFITKFK